MQLEVKIIDPPYEMSQPPTPEELETLYQRALRAPTEHTITTADGQVDITPEESFDTYVAECFTNTGAVHERLAEPDPITKLFIRLRDRKGRRYPEDVTIYSLPDKEKVVPMGQRRTFIAAAPFRTPVALEPTLVATHAVIASKTPENTSTEPKELLGAK